jgi:hypothetical protein
MNHSTKIRELAKSIRTASPESIIQQINERPDLTPAEAWELFVPHSWLSDSRYHFFYESLNINCRDFADVDIPPICIGVLGLNKNLIQRAYNLYEEYAFCCKNLINFKFILRRHHSPVFDFRILI